MKYVYSEKRKKVLAVDEGSPVYDAAVKKGMQLYDTKEAAEEAVRTAMEPFNVHDDGYRIEGDKVLKVPGSEVQARLDRGEVVYGSLEEANAASSRVGGDVTKEPTPNLRETALRYMDRVYKGDLKKTLDAIDSGYSMDPIETTDEQRMFITAARRVMGARTDEEVLQALAVYPGLAERLDLEARQKEWHGYAGGPPVKAILAPNLVNRKLSGAGTISKVVGAAEDAFSLVPRAIRAGIEETMPIADEMTFAERMAVPHELLTAPQALFTEGLSSIAPGMATEAAGRAALGFAGRKIPAVSKALHSQAVATGKVEPLAKAIRGVDDATVLTKGRYVANQAAKGVGEGVAFSAHPAMLEATSPDEGAVGRGMFTAAVGTAMGPLGRAAYAITPFGYKAAIRNMSDDVLSPAGRELRSGLGPYERIGSALAADERVLEKGGVPRAMAPESESRLRTLTKSIDDIASAREGLDMKRYRLFSDFANDLPEAPRRPMNKDEIRSFMIRAEQAGIPEEEASDLLASAQRYSQVPYLEYPGQVDVPAVYAEGPLPEVPVTPTVDPELDALLVELGLDGASLEELGRLKEDPDYILNLLNKSNDKGKSQTLRDNATSDAARMSIETSAPAYGPGAPVLVDPPRRVEVEGPPVQRYRDESEVDPRDLAKVTAWNGLNSKDPVKYLELAQPFSYYGMPDVEFPSYRLRSIDALLAGLPAQGKEQSYLQKIGQSRLDRLTAIEPYREAVKLQEDINKELGKDYSWDIPAAVAAYRRSQRPTVSSPATGLVENMIAAKIAKEAPGAVRKVASGAGKAVRISAPASGARQATRHREVAGDVPQLVIIGKGGLLQAPFAPVKKYNSVNDMK